MRQAALSNIFLQQIPALRSAIYELAHGRTEGYNKLEEFGAIHQVEDNAKRMEAIASQHLEALKDGKSSLIVAPTHGECRAVAAVVRQRLRTEGLLSGEDQAVTRLQRINLTESQRRDAINYEAGHIIKFHRIARADQQNGDRATRFKSGEQWMIVERQSSGTVVVERGGEKRSLPLTQTSRFKLYRAEKIQLAVGDQIRVTKNFRSGDARFINNEAAKVAAIDGSTITLEDGRTLGRAMLHIDQGLVVTSHAAQGKTVDQVIGSVPVNAFAQVNEAQFYVRMSRARKAMHLFTDCTATLREAVCRPSQRLSPYEILLEQEKERGGRDVEQQTRRPSAVEEIQKARRLSISDAPIN